ncbi:MAG: type II secretion system F family protein [Candidatus Omnitrophota bacterium]
MLLFAQILVIGAIALVIMRLFPSGEELHLPLREEGLEDYRKIIRPTGGRINLLRFISSINRPLLPAQMRQRLNSDLAITKIKMIAEEFMFLQEVFIVALLFVLVSVADKRHLPLAIAAGIGIGFLLPRFWLLSKANKVKREITRLLPDTIDLLTLCVNAGLDFMLALKWVVDKSQPSALTEELKNLMQEIGIGKSRRAALMSLSLKYQLPDVSSFTRSLIQADRMGTSVAQALEILSEDMRRRRFNRGEQQALKAPIKLLFPLLVFIFPVVIVIIAGPIFLQFMGSKGVFGGLAGG